MRLISRIVTFPIFVLAWCLAKIAEKAEEHWIDKL